MTFSGQDFLDIISIKINSIFISTLFSLIF